MAPVNRVDQLRADAERYLGEHVFGDALLAKALSALEEAAGLDPEDRNGETAVPVSYTHLTLPTNREV